jgi:uncharacterized membrane protein
MNRRRSTPQPESHRRRRRLGGNSHPTGIGSPTDPSSNDGGSDPPATRASVPGGPFAAVYRLTAAAVLTVVGLAVALYLTATRFDPGEVALYCAIGSGSCEQVAGSQYSMIGDVPVSVFGIAWFVGMLILVGLSLYHSTDLLRTARLAWTACGIAVVCYLIYAEIFLIGAICEWCTSVHVITVVLFALSVWEALDVRARNHCIPAPDLLA